MLKNQAEISPPFIKFFHSKIMSMTKNFYHETICAMNLRIDEESYFHSFSPEIDETEIDWFADYRLAHDGYLEDDSTIPKELIIDEEIPF